MAGVFQMRIDAVARTAQAVSNRADELQEELAEVGRCWMGLSAKWTGLAGSAYQPVWEEWSENAGTIAAILVEHSDLLVRSAAMLIEHENQQTGALGAVGGEPQ